MITNLRIIQIRPSLFTIFYYIFREFCHDFFNPYNFTKLIAVLDLFGQVVNDLVCQTILSFTEYLGVRISDELSSQSEND